MEKQGGYTYMKTRIMGVYEKEQLLKEEVQKLKGQGYEPVKISVVVGKEEFPTLFSEDIAMGVNVEKVATKPEGEGDFVSTIKNALNTEAEEERKAASENQFVRLGLTQLEAEKYREDVDAGRLVLLLHAEKPELQSNQLNKDIRPVTPIQQRERETEEFSETSETAHAAQEKILEPKEVRTEGMTEKEEEMQAVQQEQQTHKHVTEEAKEHALQEEREQKAAARPEPAPAKETERGEEDEEQALKLREEQLDINKKEVEKGEVGVRKRIIEEEKTIKVPVQREEVYVERRSVKDRPEGGEIKEETEEIRIPIKEEEVEIRKKPVVTEEVFVGKRTYEDTEESTEKVKREEAEIDEEGRVDGKTNYRGTREE
jgi:uncharacterized protein (TIGR02271 family)